MAVNFHKMFASGASRADVDPLVDVVRERDRLYGEAMAQTNGHARTYAAAYLLDAASYWLSKRDRAPKTGPETTKIRFHGEDSAKDFVQGAADKATAYLKTLYALEDEAELRKAIAEDVGVRLSEAFVAQDTKEVAAGHLHYLGSKEERFDFKIRFRQGRAYRWDRAAKTPKFALYDSWKAFDTQFKDGWAHFAMDRDGRLYVGRSTRFTFYHSSYLSGAAALCAGLVRIRNGEIREISDESGHYKPWETSIAHMLRRLEVYRVAVDKIKVTIHTRGLYSDTAQKHPARYILARTSPSGSPR